MRHKHVKQAGVVRIAAPDVLSSATHCLKMAPIDPFPCGARPQFIARQTRIYAARTTFFALNMTEKVPRCAHSKRILAPVTVPDECVWHPLALHPRGPA